MAAVGKSKGDVGTETDARMVVSSVTKGTTEVVVVVVVGAPAVTDELGSKVEEAMDRRQSDIRLLELELVCRKRRWIAVAARLGRHFGGRG